MQKILDSHFHIWRRADLPWLDGPPVPRIFGEYDPIRRDYPMAEYRADTEGTGIEASVYVQTNWGPGDFEREAAWVHEVASETGWPAAFVGYADMTEEDVRPQLDTLMKYPLTRGVRMQLHWHEVAQYRFAPDARQVADPTVKRNIARLADYGLSFDLQVFPAQMDDAARLVQETPDVDFILTHCGMLTARDAATQDAWAEGLARFAGLPNFFAKMSGLGTFEHRNDPGLIDLVYDHAVGILGTEKLMFGSNFPIEKLWTELPTLVASHRKAAQRHGAEEDILWRTAAKVYRLQDGSADS